MQADFKLGCIILLGMFKTLLRRLSKYPSGMVNTERGIRTGFG